MSPRRRGYRARICWCPCRTMASGRDPVAGGLPPHAMRRMRVVFALLGAGLAIHVAHALLGFGGSALNRLITDADYDLILVGSAAACIARAGLVKEERRVWSAPGTVAAPVAARDAPRHV